MVLRDAAAITGASISGRDAHDWRCWIGASSDEVVKAVSNAILGMHCAAPAI